MSDDDDDITGSGDSYNKHPQHPGLEISNHTDITTDDDAQGHGDEGDADGDDGGDGGGDGDGSGGGHGGGSGGPLGLSISHGSSFPSEAGTCGGDAKSGGLCISGTGGDGTSSEEEDDDGDNRVWENGSGDDSSVEGGEGVGGEGEEGGTKDLRLEVGFSSFLFFFLFLLLFLSLFVFQC